MLGAMAVLPSAASRLPRCRRTGHQLVAAPLVDGTSGAEVKADADATREVVARESSIDRASFSALVRLGGDHLDRLAVQTDKDSGSQGFAQPSCDVVKNAHERVSDTWFCGRWLGDDGERHGRLGLDLFDPNDGFAGRCVMQPVEGDTPPVGVDLNWRPQRVDLRRRWRWVAAGPGSRLPAIDRRVQNPDGSQCGGALDPPCGKRPRASIVLNENSS